MASTRKKGATGKREPPGPRKYPVQQRSQERFARILNVSAQIIADKGSDGLTMKEVAEKAEVSFGSLYQYFPDKSAVILTLAERFNERGQRCVEDVLARIDDPADLKAGICAIVDGFYELYLAEPVMRHIWHATKADRRLRDIEGGDMDAHIQILASELHRLLPQGDAAQLFNLARLLNHQIAATVRLAITLDRADAEAVLAMYKRSIPQNPFSMLG